MLIDREKMLVLPFSKAAFERPSLRKLLEPVITGFNTDIEHDGVVYHVQTEDKGLDSPIILSLVYSGGTILASKRSPYEDLIAQGFSDEALAERLKRQHRLICAAIHSGRINDLKKMSGGRAKVAPAAPASVVAAEPVETVDVIEEEVEEVAPEVPVEQPFEIEYWPMTQEWTPPPPPSPASEGNVSEEPEPLAAEELGHEETAPLEDLPREIQPDGLAIILLDDEQFYSGEKYTLRVHISSWLAGEEKSLANAGVSIKILGTTFRPLIYSVKTEDDGVATVATEVPHFTSGRAAVLIRATVKDEAAELRRIIHPAR